MLFRINGKVCGEWDWSSNPSNPTGENEVLVCYGYPDIPANKPRTSVVPWTEKGQTIRMFRSFSGMMRAFNIDGDPLTQVQVSMFPNNKILDKRPDLMSISLADYMSRVPVRISVPRDFRGNYEDVLKGKFGANRVSVDQNTEIWHIPICRKPFGITNRMSQVSIRMSDDETEPDPETVDSVPAEKPKRKKPVIRTKKNQSLKIKNEIWNHQFNVKFPQPWWSEYLDYHFRLPGRVDETDPDILSVISFRRTGENQLIQVMCVWIVDEEGPVSPCWINIRHLWTSKKYSALLKNVGWNIETESQRHNSLHHHRRPFIRTENLKDREEWFGWCPESVPESYLSEMVCPRIHAVISSLKCVMAEDTEIEDLIASVLTSELSDNEVDLIMKISKAVRAIMIIVNWKSSDYWLRLPERCISGQFLSPDPEEEIHHEFKSYKNTIEEFASVLEPLKGHFAGKQTSRFRRTVPVKGFNTKEYYFELKRSFIKKYPEQGIELPNEHVTDISANEWPSKMSWWISKTRVLDRMKAILPRVIDISGHDWSPCVRRYLSLGIGFQGPNGQTIYCMVPFTDVQRFCDRDQWKTYFINEGIPPSGICSS